MKRFLVLLLTLGILVVADPTSLLSQEKEKDKDEKKDKDKDKDKKDKEKKDKDKDDKDKDKKDKEKPVDKPLTDAQKEELKALSGTFKVVEFERDGKKTPEEERKTMRIVQKGADWTFTSETESTSGKDTPYPDKSPKEIDSLYNDGPARDKVVKGIYKIDKDTITYCWADVDKDRPKDFSPKADSGQVLMVLRRMSKDELDKEKLEKDKDKAKKDKDKDEKKDKDKTDDKKKDKDKDKDKDKKADK